MNFFLFRVLLLFFVYKYFFTFVYSIEFSQNNKFLNLVLFEMRIH